MYVGRYFDRIDTGEVEDFTFDFSRSLAKGETILSSSWACSVQSGTDPAPGSRLIGAAGVANPMSTQKIGNMLAGVTYLLQATATTDRGNTLILWSFVACKSPGVVS